MWLSWDRTDLDRTGCGAQRRHCFPLGPQPAAGTAAARVCRGAGGSREASWRQCWGSAWRPPGERRWLCAGALGKASWHRRGSWALGIQREQDMPMRRNRTVRLFFRQTKSHCFKPSEDAQHPFRITGSTLQSPPPLPAKAQPLCHHVAGHLGCLPHPLCHTSIREIPLPSQAAGQDWGRLHTDLSQGKEKINVAVERRRAVLPFVCEVLCTEGFISHEISLHALLASILARAGGPPQGLLRALGTAPQLALPRPADDYKRSVSWQPLLWTRTHTAIRAHRSRDTKVASLCSRGSARGQGNQVVQSRPQ